MNGGEFMVVLIVAIVMIASIVRSQGRFHHRRRPEGEDSPIENQRLRDEVRQLKDRIQVLERITVEKENSIARQIEELRDR
jgi:hypothetical protein